MLFVRLTPSLPDSPMRRTEVKKVAEPPASKQERGELEGNAGPGGLKGSADVQQACSSEADQHTAFAHPPRGNAARGRLFKSDWSGVCWGPFQSRGAVGDCRCRGFGGRKGQRRTVKTGAERVQSDRRSSLQATGGGAYQWFCRAGRSGGVASSTSTGESDPICGCQYPTA